MSALDDVLEAYRDMFGVKTARANETHRLACEEVAKLREATKQRLQSDVARVCETAFVLKQVPPRRQ